MRSKVFHIFCLFTCFLFVPSIIAAELSITNRWRIEQASDSCRKTENALTIAEYWGDTVTDENRETVCIAEQFGRLVADEGDAWLKNASVEFINQCKTISEKNDAKYFSCLQARLKKITRQLSSPCKELGEAGLWDEGLCRKLVTYIFTKSFDEVLQANRPFLEKITSNEKLKLLSDPIAVIVLLVLYVLDIVVFMGPDNWYRVPKFGLIVGTIVLASWFLPEEYRFIGMAVAVFICVGGIIWNHIAGLFDSDKKKEKYSRRKR